jgi:hypothetical protein
MVIHEIVWLNCGSGLVAALRAESAASSICFPHWWVQYIKQEGGYLLRTRPLYCVTHGVETNLDAAGTSALAHLLHR